MPSKGTDIIASLERLGLSPYESKAYLAAVGQPPMTCYKLAQLSGVPRARIYETVEKLAAKGFLVFQSGDRTLLAAANYKQLLEQKESEARENFDRLRKSLAALPSPESSGIWNVQGRAHVLQAVRDLLGAAERYVYIKALAEDVLEIQPALEKARRRKAEIHGIYCGELPGAPPGFLKHLGKGSPVCSEIAVVADGKRVLVGCTQPENSAAAAMTQNGGIIHVVREYVRHEVFLNSLFGGKTLATEEHYVRKYRNLMRRLP